VDLIVASDFLILPGPDKSIFGPAVTSRRRRSGAKESPQERVSGIHDRIEEDESLRWGVEQIERTEQTAGGTGNPPLWGRLSIGRTR
jgi:hypothetical protein